MTAALNDCKAGVPGPGGRPGLQPSRPCMSGPPARTFPQVPGLRSHSGQGRNLRQGAAESGDDPAAPSHSREVGHTGSSTLCREGRALPGISSRAKEPSLPPGKRTPATGVVRVGEPRRGTGTERCMRTVTAGRDRHQVLSTGHPALDQRDKGVVGLPLPKVRSREAATKRDASVTRFEEHQKPANPLTAGKDRHQLSHPASCRCLSAARPRVSALSTGAGRVLGPPIRAAFSRRSDPGTIGGVA